MSENKPHPEADAVLSKIRSIVTRTHDAAQEEREAPRAERLLLTPSLRIDHQSADDDPEIADLPPRRRPRVTTRTLTAERITLEQRISELEKAVSDDGSWEPDGSETVDVETPQRFPFPFRPEPEIEEATILENPIFVPEREPDPEPAREDDSAHFAFRSDRADREPSATEPEFAPQPVADDDQDEPPTAGEPEKTSLVDLPEESVIDEDMLRDIVAEIVRQELQGELGERITRNVRKLVRREIHRAIMTRDFG